jgi:hypothetical protein
MMKLYQIAFSGRLLPGAQADAVKANLARLFQADAQRIALLFSGQRMVIKNNLDEAAAERYRVALERAGAQAEVSAMEVDIEEVEMAPPPADPRGGPAPLRRLQVTPRDRYMAAFAEVEAPDFGIAPLGADLQQHKPEPPPPALDLSALSLAPVGSDMGQSKAPPAAPAPDVSHIELQ